MKDSLSIIWAFLMTLQIFCRILWKHERRPVWHAGFSDSTWYNNASMSQSKSISLTCWTLPDSSPFTHNLLREVLQKQAFPVLIVFLSASSLAYASISISFVSLSWTTTGSKPFRLAKSISNMDLTIIDFFTLANWDKIYIIKHSILTCHSIEND